MKHWVQLLAIANCCGSSSNADSSALAQLRKKVADLERRVRSGSPTMRAVKASPTVTPTHLQFETNPAGKARRTREAAKAKAQAKETKGRSQDLHNPCREGLRPQEEHAPSLTNSCLAEQNSTSATRPSQVSVFNFQSHRCKDKKCKRAHACAGWDKANTPFVDCLCLEGVHLTWYHRPRFPTL